MNKKIAIILTLMMVSTTSIMGCSSKVKVESDTDSIPDTVFTVSSEEDDTDSSTESEQNDSTKTESTNSSASNSKTTQSTSSNKASSNKETTTKSTSSNTAASTNTTASTKKAESTTKAKTGKTTTFTAKAGYTLTFPANWEGKYEVKEDANKLTVNYKCSKDKTSKNPYLFSIEKFDPNENYDYFDTVGKTRKFKVGNTEYIIGGPTDVGLSESSKDFKDYIEINRQKAEVANSLKVTK